MSYTPVAKTNEIPVGQMKVCQVGGIRLAICNVAGEFFAIEDLCTHDDGPLGEGALVNDVVECPRHGAKFCVKTGEVKRMPAITPIKTFPVQVKNGDISVSIENSGTEG